MPAPSLRRLAACLVCSSLWLAACTGSRPEPTLEERFGSAPDSLGDGSERLEIVAADSARAYFYAPAILESIVVRSARMTVADTARGVPVEVLIKGALPDACAELHRVTQQRTAHLVDVTLTMRRPQGAVCATVVRPYRFYVLLDGTYTPGPYTLTVNGTVKPFEILAPEEDDDE